MKFLSLDWEDSLEEEMAIHKDKTSSWIVFGGGEYTRPTYLNVIVTIRQSHLLSLTCSILFS